MPQSKKNITLPYESNCGFKTPRPNKNKSKAKNDGEKKKARKLSQQKVKLLK